MLEVFENIGEQSRNGLLAKQNTHGSEGTAHFERICAFQILVKKSGKEFLAWYIT